MFLPCQFSLYVGCHSLYEPMRKIGDRKYILGILNGRHPATAQCARGAEQKMRRLAEADLRESTERPFEEYGETLENVTAFKYLVRVLTEVYDDWMR